ncbi:MAG TPA: cbb3-type cytochrome c oxidase subunit I [Bacilli bacterium]
MGILFLRAAVVYFVLGVVLGMVMGMTGDFKYTSSHAHINLLGWASLALAGVIYHLFPKAGGNRLAKIHFWMHNVGLIGLVSGMFMVVNEFGSAGSLLAASATITVIGVIIFAMNVWMNVKANSHPL